MKKSVIILIAIIYLASVALVSFYGLQPKLFDEVVYVDRIEFLNEDIKPKDDGTLYAVIRGADSDGLWRYQIEYRAYPDNATDKTVDYTILSPQPNVEIDEETGLVTFKKRGVVTIMLKPRDGSDVSVTLEIWAR